MEKFQIVPVSKELLGSLRDKIDHKTKPLGSLGQLEDLALKIGLIQNTESPQLKNPHIVVFASDHGITAEGVSTYPCEVTYQMVMNFLNKGAAINVFCQQNDIAIKIVDAGVQCDLPPHDDLINAKIAKGTKSFLNESAMSLQECQQGIDKGADIVLSINQQGCNVIGFGEMGIGNTTSASILMSQICRYPISECIGRGTGLDDAQLGKKLSVCEKAISNHQGITDDPVGILSTFGGFEIAMICGAMLQAAEKRMVILVDGFISSAAFLVAYSIDQNVKDYAIFCHQSDESGHAKMLEYLKVKPILDLGMRLGEGTGAAMAYPIIQSAVQFLNEMASFESAGVSDKK